MEGGGYKDEHIQEQDRDGLKKKGSRLPNWEKNETLVLVRSIKTYDDDTKDGKSKGHIVNHDMKWSKISALCGEGGVKRDPEKCRRRWQTIFTDYKRIRGYESKNGQESYWRMSARDRKDNGLPAVFDRDIFEVMDVFLRNTAKVRVQLGSAMIGESLKGDTDEPSYSLDGPSPKVLTLPIQVEPGTQGEEQPFQQSSGTAREDPPPFSTRRKRRRDSHKDAGGEQIIDAIESSARLLIKSQERISDLNRISRERIAKLDREQRERQCATMSFAIHFLADAIRGVANSMRGTSKDK